MWVLAALAAEFSPSLENPNEGWGSWSYRDLSLTKPFCGVSRKAWLLSTLKRRACSCDPDHQVKTGLDRGGRTVMMRGTRHNTVISSSMSKGLKCSCCLICRGICQLTSICGVCVRQGQLCMCSLAHKYIEHFGKAFNTCVALRFSRNHPLIILHTAALILEQLPFTYAVMKCA